jgi:hypothetical protein
MIPPDEEIYEVEKRIAERRSRVEAAFKATGRQTLRALSSPWALAAAGIAGFVLAGGLRHLRKRDAHVAPSTAKAAKASTASSIALAAATWLIKSQFGSPLEMARFFIDKVRSRKPEGAPAQRLPAAPPRSSGVPDRLRPKRRQATTAG